MNTVKKQELINQIRNTHNRVEELNDELDRMIFELGNEDYVLCEVLLKELGEPQ